MSFLAPLFLLGGMAIAAPLLFHLIRRNTKEKFTFSSLMFLRADPPTVTRKSKLEDILLLLVRCALYRAGPRLFATVHPAIRIAAARSDRGPACRSTR